MKCYALMALLVCAAANAQNNPLPETPRSDIEYRSVSEALAGLRAKPGTQISTEGSWTIAHEPAASVIWSFAPESHAAYPSVVKRAIVTKDGIVGIKMDVICQADKNACDALVREFIQLNEKWRSSFPSQK